MGHRSSVDARVLRQRLAVLAAHVGRKVGAVAGAKRTVGQKHTFYCCEYYRYLQWEMRDSSSDIGK